MCSPVDFIYVYIYIYMERERERGGEREKERWGEKEREREKKTEREGDRDREIYIPMVSWLVGFTVFQRLLYHLMPKSVFFKQLYGFK